MGWWLGGWGWAWSAGLARAGDCFSVSNWVGWAEPIALELAGLGWTVVEVFFVDLVLVAGLGWAGLGQGLLGGSFLFETRLGPGLGMGRSFLFETLVSRAGLGWPGLAGFLLEPLFTLQVWGWAPGRGWGLGSGAGIEIDGLGDSTLTMTSNS